MLRFSLRISALTVLLSLCGVAQAGIDYGIVTGKFNGWDTRGNQTGTVWDTPAIDGGRFNFNVTSTTGLTLPAGLQLPANPLQLYCMEVNQFVRPDDKVSYHLVDLDMAPVGGTWAGSSGDSGPPMTTEAIALIRDLYANYWGSAGNSSNAGKVGSFQLDLWAMEYYGKTIYTAFLANNKAYFTTTTLKQATGGSVILANGEVNLNGDALLWLNESLTRLSNGENKWANVYALVNPYGTSTGAAQDQFVLLSAPEPGSLLVWGTLGLVGVVYARRQKRTA